MKLGTIERGTKLKVFEEHNGSAVSDEFDAVFRSYETGRLFTILSPGLYENYAKLHPKATLNIRFISGASLHNFKGYAVEKQHANGIILVEQATEISSVNRREYERDELRVKVKIYGLSEKKLHTSRFSWPEMIPDISDITYDVSAGGICVISNVLLNSKYDPYYLIEFALTSNEKDSFLLPAKLVRRSNYPRTKIGRYDYGFQFIYDHLPDAKSRVTRAILSRKLALR